MMITILRFHDGPEPIISRGVTQCLINHILAYGPIVSLDKWAHEWGLYPGWVRRCARQAADQGLLELTRLESVTGRPYKVDVKIKQEENA